MERDGHADLQLVALVDPHRRLSAVRLPISFAIHSFVLHSGIYAHAVD